MTDIVERLRALEACEMELAHDGDCPPEATANWKHAETCREAASEIERLRAAMKLKIDEKQFLDAVDREGDYECGVGKLADDLLPPPPAGEPSDE